MLSVGVVLSSAVIFFFPTREYPWSKYLDPFCTLVFSILIVYTCRGVLSNGIYILMEGSPTAIDTQQMMVDIQTLKFVDKVHDYHCWSLSRGKYAMSCHIAVTEEPMTVLKLATKIVNDYGIEHVTIQMELDIECQQKEF